MVILGKIDVVGFDIRKNWEFDDEYYSNFVSVDKLVDDTFL